MKRSKLLIGCYLLSIIMATVSIGVSVAWYASAAQLRIETLEIGVHADKSLMITDKSPEDYPSMDAFIESFEKHEFDNADHPPLFGKSEVDVYTLQGRLVARKLPVAQLRKKLPRGVYIIEGTKVVIR